MCEARISAQDVHKSSFKFANENAQYAFIKRSMGICRAVRIRHIARNVYGIIGGMNGEAISEICGKSNVYVHV